MRGRSRVAALIVATAPTACASLVDVQEWGNSPDGGATTAGGGAQGGGGAGGGAPPCASLLFEVTFDEQTNPDCSAEPPDSCWYAPTLWQVGYGGVRVEQPTRAGAGAWRIPIDQAQFCWSELRSHAVAEDEEYWFGFSMLYEEGNPIYPGTSFFRMGCDLAENTTYPMFFRLGMDDQSPLMPFRVLEDLPATQDDLATIELPAGFSDWVVHFLMSPSTHGYVELYFDGELRYAYAGPTMDAKLGCRGLWIDAGLYRWDAPGSAAIVLDELRLARGPDAQHTVTPTTTCR